MRRTETKSIERAAFRIGEFCQAIGISRSKVYDLIGKGRIHTVAVDGCRLIPATELVRLLATFEGPKS